MKNFKILLAAILLIAISVLRPTPSYAQPAADELKNWHLADFSGQYDGQKVCDVFYSDQIGYVSGLIYMEIILMTTDYGKAHYSETGFPSSNTKGVYKVYIVDFHSGKYCLESSQYVYTDDSKSDIHTFSTSNDSDWQTPTSASLAANYVNLAKKLAVSSGYDTNQ